MCCASGFTMFLGPSPYLSASDLPFNTNGFSYFVLEDLEDGILNPTGALVNTGWSVLFPALLTDSVDGDDGLVDGSGTGGHSAFSTLSQSNLTVTFDPGVLGTLMPTHAGVVCTDIGHVSSGILGFGDVTFTAYDTNGLLLGSITATNFGNGAAFGDGAGATAEDRFFGVIHAQGLGSVRLSIANSVDWEVDHLQYGRLGMPAVAPVLRIEFPKPNAARLAWATNAIGFQLEESPTLAAVGWTAVTSMPVVVGAEYHVTLSPSSNRFFRLSGTLGNGTPAPFSPWRDSPPAGWDHPFPGVPAPPR